MKTADEQLSLELRELSLNESSFRALALLPLVEVAWADHSVQPRERTKIMEIAKGHGLLEGRSARLVEAWLTRQPSKDYFRKGRELLVKLAHRSEGLGNDLPPEALETVVDFCSHVAESAGGVLDVFFTTSAAEKAAIREIAEAIEASSERHADPTAGIVGHTIGFEWQKLLKELEED
jgi:tellurite resistance protein